MAVADRLLDGPLSRYEKVSNKYRDFHGLINPLEFPSDPRELDAEDTHAICL